VIRDGRLFQREFRRTDDGKEVDLNVREARYVLGSGEKGRTCIAEQNGYLTAMPLGWYSNVKTWDASPGYQRSNQRFGRQIVVECMGCHNAPTALHPGSVNAYATPLPTGVGCQKCHGPAAKHVEMREAGVGKDPLVVLKQLPPDRKQDVCLQCHMAADFSVVRSGRTNEFRPGERLRDSRGDFFETSKESNFVAVGHGPRSMASRCYTESGGKMTCVHCHDPHSPAASQSNADYNRKCMDCHDRTPCNRPLKPREAPTDGDCVACHMPRRKADDIPHAVATEHWIHRFGRPTGSPFQSTAEETNEGLISFWKEDRNSLERLSGRLRHALRTNDDSSLLRAAEELEAATRNGTPPVEQLLDLARARIKIEDWPRARLTLERALRVDPNSFDANYLYGESLLRARAPEAIDQLEKTLRAWPWHNRSDRSLARALLGKGQAKKILELDREYFSHHPPDPTVLEIVAEARSRLEAPKADVEAALRAAIRADGAQAGPYVMLAERATAGRRLAEAGGLLRQALTVDPGSASARLALAQFLANQGRWNDAMREVQAVMDAEPSNNAAHNLWRQLNANRQARGTPFGR
jgi:tetratricopeptide (TPR) repeat protein